MALKKFCSPLGRVSEAIGKLSDDERSRAAQKIGSGMFSDVCVQVWPSRSAMLKTIDMQSRREPHPTDWRPLVKRQF